MGDYYFYRCIHCGEWYYSIGRIKRKKCWKCNHSFDFDKSSKFRQNCTSIGAISIIKELKKKSKKEDLINYLK